MTINDLHTLKGASIIKQLKLNQRRSWWFLVSYNPISDYSSSLEKCSHWAYILHDKDTDDKGELETPHYHILVHYDNSRSGVSVLKDFIGVQNTLIEKVDSPIGCYEYLTHLNDVDKYQYASSEIVSHNPVYWEHFVPSVRDRTQYDFIEDLLADDIDLVEMAKRYGRDFIKNFRSYIDFRNEVKPLPFYNDYKR